MTKQLHSKLLDTAIRSILGDAREGGGCVWRQHIFVCPTTCGNGCEDKCVVDHERVAILYEAADIITNEDLRKAVNG